MWKVFLGAVIFPQKCSPPRATIIPRNFATAVIFLAMKYPVTKALILQVQEVHLHHNQARLILLVSHTNSQHTRVKLWPARWLLRTKTTAEIRMCNDLRSLCVGRLARRLGIVHSIGNSNQISLSKIINALYNSQKNHSWHKSIMVNVSTLSYKSVNTFEQWHKHNDRNSRSRTLSKSITVWFSN